MTTSVHRSVDRLATPSHSTDSLDRSYARTHARTDVEPYSPTADISPNATHTRTYGDSAAETTSDTCDHREWTRHFEWKCDQPAGHGGRGHVLVMARPIEEAP